MFSKALPSAPAFSYTNYRWWTLTNATGPLERGIQQGVLGFYVLEITGSASLMAISVAIQGISALFMLPAGILADRFDRRLLLAASMILAGIVTLVFCIGIMAGIESYSWTIIYVTVTGILTSAQMPVSRAILPMTLPREHLLNGISLGTITGALPRVIGPGAAALFYDFLGPWAAFSIGAFVLFVGAFAVLPMKLAPIDMIESSTTSSGVGNSAMSEVISFLRTRRELITVIGLMCVTGLFMMGPVNYGAPIIFTEIHQTDATQLGLAWAMLSAGMVVSSLFISSMRELSNKGGFFGMALMGGGFCVAAQVLAPTPALTIFFFFVWGCFGGFFMNMSQALLQMRTPDQYMGRVMSLSTLAMLGLMPLGVAQVALLDNAVGLGTQSAVTISGVLCFLLALSAVLFHKEFRQAR